MYVAANGGNFDVSKILVNHEAIVNIPDKNHCTPLYVAASRGHFDVSKLLLQHGADVNIHDEDGLPPLYAAASGQHFDIFKLLLEHGANINIPDKEYHRTPLRVAVWDRNLDLCKFLLDHGADVNIPDKRKETPLHFAAAMGYPSLDICKLLLEHGANVHSTDKFHQTPLYTAARSRHFVDLDLMKLLLQHGSDPNIESSSGYTPLTIAAKYKHYEICKYLMLETDVDCNKVGKYYGDLLCHASYYGDLELCQKLVQSLPDSDINMKNDSGETALNTAAEGGQYQIWNYLLNQGANINISNNDGQNSLYFFSRRGLKDLVKKSVEEYGADVQSKDCLSVSAIQEQYDVLDYLLNQGATWEDINEPIKDKLTPFYFVCRGGLIDPVRKFVQEYNADINGEGCLHVALEFYYTPVAEFLIKSGCNINQVKI